MKKYISIITIMVIIILGIMSINVYSADLDPNATIKVEPLQATVGIDENEFSVTIKLDTMENIPKDTILGFQSSMVYDENIIESVSFSTESDWDKPKYSSQTKTLLIAGDEVSKEGSVLTTMTFKIKDGLTQDYKTSIKLSNIIISSGENIEINTLDKEISVNINRIEENTKEEEKPSSGSTNKENNSNPIKFEDKTKQTTTTIDTTTTKQTKTDSTISGSKLPQTGVSSIILVIISIIIVASIFCIIRYKTILR